MILFFSLFGGKETTQWLGTLVLVEDPGSVPALGGGWPFITPVPGDLTSSSHLHGHQTWYIYVHAGKTHTHKKQISLNVSVPVPVCVRYAFALRG